MDWKLIKNTDSFSSLSDDVKTELFQEAFNGNKKAKEEIVRLNLPLVLYFVDKFKRNNVPHEDMVQEGLYALLRSVEDFNPEKGFQFSTFAGKYIKTALYDYRHREGKLIKVPIHITLLANKVEALEKKYALEDELIDYDKIAEEIGASKKRILKSKYLNRQTISIDSEFYMHIDEDGVSESVVEEPELTDVELQDLKEEIEEALSFLPEFERTVLEYHYGVGGKEALSYIEIAHYLNLSPSMVRDAERRGLEELKEYFGA